MLLNPIQNFTFLQGIKRKEKEEIQHRVWHFYRKSVKNNSDEKPNGETLDMAYLIYRWVLHNCRKTFWGVVKKKSTENYKGVPYITTLLSTSLWTFYGLIKPDILVVSVNGVGAIFQFIYVTLFLIYAPKDTKVTFIDVSLSLLFSYFAK